MKSQHILGNELHSFKSVRNCSFHDCSLFQDKNDKMLKRDTVNFIQIDEVHFVSKALCQNDVTIIVMVFDMM